MAKEKTFPIKIGLEVHGYLDTKEKLFCMCRTSGDSSLLGDFENPSQLAFKSRGLKLTHPPTQDSRDLNAHQPSAKPNKLVKTSSLNKLDKPNSRVCPICTGQPGSKPMLANKSAVDKLIQISLVLGCKINHDKNLIWQRKHYDWADLPKGYQNTISGAYSIPCAENGKFMGVRIRETHLEEDPAQWNPDTGRINYNRSGLPLIEIVTEPDFFDAEQVIEWLKSLVHSLSYIRAVKKSAGIKADVNVSTYGERVEIKNLNSLENIRHAIDYEVARQLENYEKGIVQKRETFAYDAGKGKTVKMREKESGEDYRFIPEPDLPVIKLNEKEIREIERELPEMPEKKLEKLLKKFAVGEKDAKILTKNLELVEFFEKLAGAGVDVKKNLSWITIELLRILNYNKKTLDEVEILPEHLAELIREVDKGSITVLKAKQIMNDFVPKSFSISEKSGFEKITEVDGFCRKVIKENQKVVEEYKAGKEQALNYLIGMVMKASGRRADFKVVTEKMKEMIS